METVFNFIQIIISLVLITVLLLQVKGTGGGLFGSATTAFRTRRGFEQTLFRSTIVLVVAFIVVSLVSADIVS